MNSFGIKFRFTTFGESHGKAVGCVVDGLPAGIKLDLDFIQSQMNRRKPGTNEFSTKRSEDDVVEILSGEFEGFSTGTPICMIVFNKDQKSKDYSNIKDIFRPGHADFTYFEKYGIRDYRGGGRSSARETLARVATGSLASLFLKELGIEVLSGVCEIDGIRAKEIDFEFAKTSEIYSLDKNIEQAQKKAILNAKNSHDSVGGAVLVKIKNAPAGLGEPIYYKLDSLLASAMMGINGVKAIEIGDGFEVSHMKGSENNDQMSKSGFLSNHAGGILGGISNSNDIDIKVYFKPTPSIFKPQQSINIKHEEVTCELKGRHDPCIAIRGSVVAEAMAKIVIADLILLNMGSKIENIKRYYNVV